MLPGRQRSPASKGNQWNGPQSGIVASESPVQGANCIRLSEDLLFHLLREACKVHLLPSAQAAVLNSKEKKEKGDRECNCSGTTKLFSPLSRGGQAFSYLGLSWAQEDCFPEGQQGYVR